jgi:two-component sensor histidine kinase
MVGNSLRMAPDPEQFKASLTERLAGLARSHDLLVQTDWSRVGLEELLKSHLSAFDDPSNSRISMGGPRVLLSPQAAQHLGMAFHELATNALKYGALSRPAGRVNIAWDLKPVDGEKQMLALRWEETGGPKVKPPARRGFGSTVIERFVASGPGSSSHLDWRREGLIWNLELEL